MTAKCQHCGDPTSPWVCAACSDKLGVEYRPKAQCRCCHNELAHDLLVNQNIHIVSGSGSPDEPSQWQENNIRHLEDCR